MRSAHKKSTSGHNKGLVLLIGTIFTTSPALGDVIYQQDFENWNNANGMWTTSTKDTLGGPYTSILGRFGTSTATLNIVATNANNGGYNSDESGSNPFNITVDEYANNRNRVPYLDQDAGGGPGGNVDPTYTGGPNLDLGQAIRDQGGPPMFGPGTYAVRFDLMLFDSWDGNYAPYGPDSFMVTVNGQTLFNEKLYSSAYGTGLNFREPDEKPSENAYGQRWGDSIYRDIEIIVELTEATDLLSIDFIGQTTQSINDESWGLDNVLIEQRSTVHSMMAPEVPAPGTLAILGSGLGLLTRRKR